MDDSLSEETPSTNTLLNHFLSELLRPVAGIILAREGEFEVTRTLKNFWRLEDVDRPAKKRRLDLPTEYVFVSHTGTACHGDTR